MLCFFGRYADRAKQILCKAIVNEDPNAKVTEKISHAFRLFFKEVWNSCVNDAFYLTSNWILCVYTTQNIVTDKMQLTTEAELR